MLAALTQEAGAIPKEKSSREYNIRLGIIFTAAGFGLFLPLNVVSGLGLASWALMPFAIGVALILYAYLIPSHSQ